MKELLRVLKLALVVCAVPALTAWFAAGNVVASARVAYPTASQRANVPAAKVAYRNHVVHLTQDGLTHGRVVAIDSVSKSQSPLSSVDVFFIQNGAVVQHTLTDDNGKFVIDGLSAGAYSFVAASAKGFAAYAVRVMPYDASVEANQMYVPTVAPRFRSLKSLAEKYLPSSVDAASIETEIPTSLRSERDIPAGGNLVQVRDGVLRGQLSHIVEGHSVAQTHVALIQQDKIVAETVTNDLGGFSFSDVKPGAYDFVVAGDDAFAAVGFEAVQDAANQEPAAEQPTEQSVVDQDPIDPDSIISVEETLDVAVTPVDDADVVAEKVDAAYDACGGEVIVSDSFSFDGMPLEQYGGAIGCGACAGSCGCGMDSDYYGGGGGGGGGFGMYGPLTSLAQLALAGWIISEVVNDNDNNNIPNIPPPVSPGG